MVERVKIGKTFHHRVDGEWHTFQKGEEVVKDSLVERAAALGKTFVTPVGGDSLEKAVVEPVAEPVAEPSPAVELPDFDKMSKSALEEWALEHLGVDLDKRKKKSDLIKEIKALL